MCLIADKNVRFAYVKCSSMDPERDSVSDISVFSARAVLEVFFLICDPGV